MASRASELSIALKVAEGRLKKTPLVTDDAMRTARFAIAVKRKLDNFGNKLAKSTLLIKELAEASLARLLDAWVSEQDDKARERAIQFRICAIKDALGALGCKPIEF